MIIGINAVTGYSKVLNNKISKKNVQNNIIFQSKHIKTIRNTGLAFAAATMLSFMSCNNTKQEVTDDNKTVISNAEKNDPANALIDEKNQAKRHYHYFAKENNEITADGYDWSELVYPNGKIERDSMGYSITIDPDGKRTVIYTKTDDSGHEIVTKEFPDGTKVIRTYYSTDVPNEILYVETNYWSNGKMKERNYYNEYPVNINEPYGEKAIEKSTYMYNENEVLIMWETNQVDPERSAKNNKYDKKGRLVYDDVKNEKYEYKQGDKNPYRAISEIDGCKRIKLFNSDGSLEREFFKAQDGTITDAEVK